MMNLKQILFTSLKENLPKLAPNIGIAQNGLANLISTQGLSIFLGLNGLILAGQSISENCQKMF